MQRSKNIIFNIAFALNCLLIFLLLFEERLVLPAGVQVIGRMHPLLLHFPITLLVVYILWTLFIDKKNNSNEFTQRTGSWLLLFVALTAALTALMGLLLSRENGYDAEAIQWHKWSGIAVAVITLLWYAWREKIKAKPWLNASIAIVSFVVIIIAGHQGADITHGNNYLLAPVMPEKQPKKVLFENAVVYTDMVQPILQAKCYSCHNAKKAKGQLVMETEALLLKGGKSGKLWDSTATNYGLLLSRVHLPADVKKHMPPTGKPQLTEQEIEILHAWIKSGASFTVKVASLPPTDTLRMIAGNLFSTIETDDYDFASADEKKIKALNTNYRVVAPLAEGSPALNVEFYSPQAYQPGQLQELLPIKEQIVSLNLNKMPVKDDELKTIGQFVNLRKLNLSFTDITGKTLGELSALKELQQLSLSGTAVKKDDITALAPLKKLSHLFAWSTSLSPADIAAVQNVLKAVTIEKGFNGDTALLKLTPPILQNEEQIINKAVTLQLKHYIKGVTIRYTTDGTEPDSVHSPQYNDHIVFTEGVALKAKAFKPGWIGSDVMETYFYSAKYKADTAINQLPADEQYKGEGGKTLIDLVKGETNNFRNGKWLGYRKNKMSTLLLFATPVNVKSVTLSTLIDIGGYIMPPVSVEVWGGNDSLHLKLLKRMEPEQPTKVIPAFAKALELSFTPVTVQCLKVVAVPVPKLPLWHPGKNDKGWIFTDEIFVN